MEKIKVPSGYELKENWLAAVPKIKEQQKDFTFGIQTDTHHCSGHNSPDCGSNLSALTQYVSLDFICNLGDILRGYADLELDTTENMKKSLKEVVDNYERDATCPVLLSVGNHDFNHMYAHRLEDYKLLINQNEIFDFIVPTIKRTAPTAQFDGNSLYYYLDFPESRIRVINIHSAEGDFTEGFSTTFKITEKQLDWLQNKALKTDYSVIVMTHTPLIAELASNNVANREKAVKLITDFRDNGGEVIAFIYGHEHAQSSAFVDGINHIGMAHTTWNAEIFTVDKANKKLTSVFIGNEGKDRSFDY